jgi:hypothetical protein
MHILFAIVLVLVFSSSAAAEQVGGYTNVSYDSGHGTQVEYLTGDGRAYLWYPGNTVVLSGRWKAAGDDICFAYSNGSYNPVTGKTGGGFECMPHRLWWGVVDERMKGDVLGLQGRKRVPFKLSPARTTLAKLVARVAPGRETPELEVPAILANSEVALSCSSIIANAGRSKADMSQAATLYFHGSFMGKRCVKVDYVRAFDLARRSGTDVEAWLRILRERAAAGNPGAIAALRVVGP